MIDLRKHKITKLKEMIGEPIEILPEDAKDYSRRQSSIARRSSKFGIRFRVGPRMPYYRRFYKRDMAITFRTDGEAEELIDLLEYLLESTPIEPDLSKLTKEYHIEIAKELAKYGFRLRVLYTGNRIVSVDKYLIEIKLGDDKAVERFIDFIKYFKEVISNVNKEKN